VQILERPPEKGGSHRRISQHCLQMHKQRGWLLHQPSRQGKLTPVQTEGRGGNPSTLTRVRDGCSKMHIGGGAQWKRIILYGWLRGNTISSLGKDCKSQVVGRSRCKLARWMERWAATTDDNWQQGTGTQITPNHVTSTLASDRLPHPLLDGGQGKTALAHQFIEDGQATDWDTDGSDGDGTIGPGNNGEGAASNKATAIGNRAVHPIHQRDCIHPSNTSLSTNYVHLHPSEATPIPKGSTPPLVESMMVNEVNLLVNGSSPVPVYCVHAAAHEQRVGGLNPGIQLAPNSLEGLHPPVLAATGTLVTGSETDKLRLQKATSCPTRHAITNISVD
jgi:hypothetical protein